MDSVRSMRNVRGRHIAIVVLLAIFCCGTTGSEELEKKQLVSLAVVVNAQNPSKDLKLSEIRRIFRRQRKFWPNRRRISVFLPSSRSQPTERKILLEKIYRLNEKQLKRYLSNKLFSGEISKFPSTVPTRASVTRNVRKSPGAVAVLLSSRVPESKYIKVLAIDGKKPGEVGYPLIGEVVDVSAMD